MIKYKIGQNAGILWQLIDKEGEIDCKKLMKLSEIKSDKDFYMAIGWLSRENKVCFFETDDGLQIGLVG